jgi:drug/metabolite transporter (DMT)-like permease
MNRLAASPHLLMLVAVTIFGANYVVGRGVVGEVPPYTLGFVRWAGAALILAPFVMRFVRTDRPQLVRSWKLLVLCGTLMPLLGAGIAYVALKETIAVNAGIIQTSLPVLTVVIAWAVLGERITAIQAGGAALAIAGVLAIVARGDPTALLSLRFNWGDLILVGNNLALASYAVAMKRMPRDIHPMSILIAICAVGGIMHLPFAAAEVAAGEYVRPTLGALFALLFVATLPSVVAIKVWNDGIARLGPGRAGMYMYLVPVVTAVLGFLVLGESIAPYHLVGGAMIVAGVAISARTPARAPRPAAPAPVDTPKRIS